MRAGQDRGGEREVGRGVDVLTDDEKSCEKNAARSQDDKECRKEDGREQGTEESWAGLLDVDIVCNKTGRLVVRPCGCCCTGCVNFLHLSVEIREPSEHTLLWKAGLF